MKMCIEELVFDRIDGLDAGEEVDNPSVAKAMDAESHEVCEPAVAASGHQPLLPIAVCHESAVQVVI